MNKNISNEETETETDDLEADSKQVHQLKNDFLSKNNETNGLPVKIDVENIDESSKDKNEDLQVNIPSKDDNSSMELKSNHQELLENGRILRPRSKGLLKTPWRSVLRRTLKPVKRFPSEHQTG